MNPRRRKPSETERLTPCQVCGHIPSHRHHLLDFCEYGETDLTAQLCANCHELFHIFQVGILADNTEQPGRVVRLYQLLTEQITNALDEERNKKIRTLVIRAAMLLIYIESDDLEIELDKQGNMQLRYIPIEQED